MVVERDFVPITDKWLSASERKWEEVDLALEGRLQGIQASFLETRPTPDNIAQSYGIERPVSGNMAHFLTYVELIDECRVVQESHLRAAETAHSKYETEKESIREEVRRAILGRGAGKRRIDKMWKERYNPEIVHHSEVAGQQEVVQQLILRKAVLDIFSVTNNSTPNGNPLIVDSFHKLLGEAQTNFDNNPFPTAQNFQSRRPVDHFIERLTQFLWQAKDVALFSRYAYRQSPVIVTRSADCQVLDAALSFGLNSTALVQSPEVAAQLESLGKAFFGFLRRRTIHLGSGMVTAEQYPYLSLLYDILTTAFHRGNPTVIRSLDQIIDPLFGDLVQSRQMRSEMSHCAHVWAATVNKASKEVGDLVAEVHSVAEFFDKLPESVVEHITNIGSRIADGLMAYATYCEFVSKKDMGQESSVVRVVVALVNREAGAIALDQARLADNLDALGYFLRKFPSMPIYIKAGIEADLRRLIGPYQVGQEHVQDGAVDGGTKGRPQQVYERMVRENLEQSQIEEAVVGMYLYSFWRESASNEMHGRENDFLWEQILDNPTWFVSPRGDRYSSRSDLQLAERGIESITFYTDRTRSRQHRVALRLAGIDQAFELWLDTNRNLLGFGHRTIPVSISARQLFTNLLLKRLYFITSGLLAKEQQPPLDGEGWTFNLEYRRAHYRHLFSTSTRPITMESYGAVVHAREVLEDYGIDIFAEIRRRRALGTLRPDEYLTFVREVSPGQVGTLVLPNEIVYNPELVQIPL